MNMRNTVQCSGSKINPAGGDENDDHRLQDFYSRVSLEMLSLYYCLVIIAAE